MFTEYYRAKGHKNGQWSTPTTQDKSRVTKAIELLCAVATDVEKAELTKETVHNLTALVFNLQARFWRTDGGAAEVWTAESGAAGGVGADPRSLCLREWTAGAPAGGQEKFEN